MDVKLISMTSNPIDVMWVAARTCYNTQGPIEMVDSLYPKDKDITEDFMEQLQQKRWNLVSKVLNSGHQSIAEHVYFTFAIEGISRACSHQLVRHRAGIVFSQQSQRYVEIKESFDELIDLRDKQFQTTEDERYLMGICKKYFVGINPSNYKSYLNSLIDYLYDIKVNNNKPEDARNILPNATKTNITMSCNYRELIHMCNLRLCSRAQLEIRTLHNLMRKEVEKQNKLLTTYLVPTCEINGFCTEDKCCNRKLSIKELKDKIGVQYRG